MNIEKVKLYEFDPKTINWTFKVKQSKRRMKLYIKMTKAETGQWDALKEAAKPPEMGDNEFARVLFYKGLSSFMEELTEKINNLTEEEREKILEDASLEEDSAPKPRLSVRGPSSKKKILEMPVEDND